MKYVIVFDYKNHRIMLERDLTAKTENAYILKQVAKQDVRFGKIISWEKDKSFKSLNDCTKYIDKQKAV